MYASVEMLNLFYKILEIYTIFVLEAIYILYSFFNYIRWSLYSMEIHVHSTLAMKEVGRKERQPRQTRHTVHRPDKQDIDFTNHTKRTNQFTQIKHATYRSKYRPKNQSRGARMPSLENWDGGLKSLLWLANSPHTS